jgi:periplasmic copper chaperone A
MTMMKSLAAALLALLPLTAAAHEGLHLHDPYLRATPQAAAIYLSIQNHADIDDRLISATSPVAGMVMTMTSITKDNGAASMVDRPEGFVIPAGGSLVLAPGHDHLMLMGLTEALKDGQTVEVTLTFANSGPITLTVPVSTRRLTAPTDADTPFDAETENSAEGEAAADSAGHAHTSP